MAQQNPPQQLQQPASHGQQMIHEQPGAVQSGQQLQSGHMELIPQAGQQFDDDFTSEMRVVIHDLEDVARTARWCVNRMIDEGPQMADCIRVCADVAEIADLGVELITSDSPYSLEAALLFATVAEDGLPVIRSHQTPHCQESADAVARAIDSTWTLLETFGQPQLLQQVQQQLQQTQQQLQQAQPQPPSLQQIQQQPPQQQIPAQQPQQF